ncbi:MAG: SDR family NAD(P)-dependent oxidoreductase [Methylobacterium sp.]|nr:SDR family NAD(P)-dependent oxidoreductase [Methylobacterium sp.]
MGQKNAHQNVFIIGAACRLPGAANLEAFWSLLSDGRNTVKPAPTGRWSVERFLRPGAPTPGFAYTFAGGYLDDPLGFDPIPFGISPREAQQMDPQQRLLLEVVWEAFEDAGIPPSSLTGNHVGVYVGASMVDYQSGASHDPAVMESHFMTGNSLSILSNRISYIFNLQGPSFTVDSACSSSFVALDRAVAALRSGEIDTAVVGGVNLCLSPAPFIGFSQARMLSPTGLSRPFSADGDGYVRSEGAVVLILRKGDLASFDSNRLRGEIVDVAVNSDGRTSGISLPSLEGQRRLLDRFYDRVKVSPDEIAFVEAHGTGTKVGDPIEATAIGQAIGQRRSKPLPIGSVKSNIGHLEAASGLAGLLKSALALEKGSLPRSLFLDKPNDAIDFVGLNLVPNAKERPLDLARDGEYAAICNYGFGGTNAHVLIKTVPQRPKAAETSADVPVLLLAAATKDALSHLARQIVERIEQGVPAAGVARDFGHFREIQKLRLAVSTTAAVALAGLRAYAEGQNTSPNFVAAEAGAATPLVFVFSGNGSQFSEMGHAAYLASAAFRAEIAEIDATFQPLSGWSIGDRLRETIPAGDLEQTSVAQPLIYAIQSSLAAILMRHGFRPEGVLGHSVGEVAAAEAAGILTRPDATRLIFLRSRHQEKVRGLGRMMVVAAERTRVEHLLSAFGNPELEIAATNSPTSTSLSGPADLLKSFAKHCRLSRIATIALDIDYPFHSSALAPFEKAMVAELSVIRPHAGTSRFFSAVTGTEIAGEKLDADYWWRNIRQEVRFADAVLAASGGEPKTFVEISPRAILNGAMQENLKGRGIEGECLTTLSQKDTESAVDLVIGRLMAHGVPFDTATLFGPRPAEPLPLPSYPFSRNDYALPGTAEAFNAYGKTMQSDQRHPLLGARMADGSPEWRALIDPQLVPYLDDHRVDGGVIVPAAGLIEMGLAAGRDLFGEVPLELDEFDVLKALAIAEDETREVSVRYATGTSSVEIWSRKRFSAQEWSLHARGIISPLTRPETKPLDPPVAAEKVKDTAAEVYEEATLAGLDYGPLFQLVTSSERDRVTTDSQLVAPKGGLGAFEDKHVLSPISLDASFHGLFISRPQKEGEKKAHLPVRFRKICVWRHGVPIRRAITLLTQETDRFKTVSVTLMDESGKVVASVEAAVLKALYLSKATVADRTFRVEHLPFAISPDEAEALASARTALETEAGEPNPPPAWLVLRAFGISLSHKLLKATLPDGRVDAASVQARFGDAQARALADLAIANCEGFGLVKNDVLSTECPLPAPEALVTTLATNFPEAAFELRLAAFALAHIDETIRSGRTLSPPVWLREQMEAGGVLGQPVLAALREAIEMATTTFSRRLRVLIAYPWTAGVIHALQPLSQAGRIELTLAAPNRKAIDQARAFLRLETDIEFLDLSAVEGRQPAVRYDVLAGLATTSLERDGLPEMLAGFLRPESTLLLAQPGTDLTLDLLGGIWNGWLTPAPKNEAALEARVNAISARLVLERFGAQEIATQAMADGLGALLSAAAPASVAAHVPLMPDCVVIGQPKAPIFAAFAGSASLSIPADTHLGKKLDARVSAGDLPAHLVYFAEDSSADSVEALALHIEALRAIAETFEHESSNPRITVVTRGAIEAEGAPKAVQSGLWGFLRVAINEFPAVDFRLLDLATDLTPAEWSARIAQALALGGGELELSARKTGLAALRMRRGLTRVEPLAPNERAVLKFEQPGRLESFQWMKAPRLGPRAGEVEIEVSAVGLNYRDILVGLGILDDDLLGAGLTAAALGFECSGIVTRVGEGVTELAVGDRVMGFAADTFASHLVAPAWHFFEVPAGLSMEAAATVPVAFATAWFALVIRARIAKGEDVLIHGGAGGVGLAAIQIAKAFGSKVIASASSAERRAIAKAAGADFAYDSRQERFAEAIRQNHGGVDVVLNSLAGPAMIASFKLLKAFGRFVELGKVDYLSNTHLGLRPFVRNISYFGVDLDELLANDREIVEEIMREISTRLVNCSFTPLPHRVYESHEIGTAFAAMQASEHIGKIVIKPPKAAMADIAALKPAMREGSYLVVGGTSGLGLATARWLARRGAKAITLASRRGAVEDGGAAIVDAMRAHGITVDIAALDVNDPAAVEALITRMARDFGPVRGIVHAAVLLEDGMISGLQPDRLRAVLSTKLKGAENLATAAAKQPLDFFVVYSSATTVIGSPGQGAYVAANAWLEGFARELRFKGVPALAIGWGAISDVGIIARDKQLGRRLRRTTGVVGISSGESLAHLGRMLVLGKQAYPTQFYTNIAPSGAAEKLRLINAPTFAGLGLARAEEKGEDGGDLVTAIEGKEQAEAVAIIVRALRREISYILRMPEEQIDTSRPLGELGLDSLMALELQLAIERLCGTEIPMVGSADRRLGEIAAGILTKIGGEAQAEAGYSDLAQSMASMHGGGSLSAEEAAALSAELKTASSKG